MSHTDRSRGDRSKFSADRQRPATQIRGLPCQRDLQEKTSRTENRHTTTTNVPNDDSERRQQRMGRSPGRQGAARAKFCRACDRSEVGVRSALPDDGDGRCTNRRRLQPADIVRRQRNSKPCAAAVGWREPGCRVSPEQQSHGHQSNAKTDEAPSLVHVVLSLAGRSVEALAPGMAQRRLFVNSVLTTVLVLISVPFSAGTQVANSNGGKLPRFEDYPVEVYNGKRVYVNKKGKVVAPFERERPERTQGRKNE
jgi:hypothetical protein